MNYLQRLDVVYNAVLWLSRNIVGLIGQVNLHRAGLVLRCMGDLVYM